MFKTKKLPVMLGMALTLAICFQPISAGPPLLDEHPWNGYTGGNGSGNSTVYPPKQLLRNYYLLQTAPVCGFYLFRITVPVTAVQKQDVAKTGPENKNKKAQ